MQAMRDTDKVLAVECDRPLNPGADFWHVHLQRHLQFVQLQAMRFLLACEALMPSGQDSNFQGGTMVSKHARPMMADVYGYVAKLARLIWVSSALLIAASPVRAAVHGQFSVGPSGAASYAVPIQMPLGRGGMEPKLALSYDSQSGSGLAGVGWSLQGLSSISRCSPSPLQDVGEKHLPVAFKDTDRFCFDGQRLLLLSGSYGADGAEYRTESEGYSQIKSLAVAGVSTASGPAMFVVKTRSGVTMEFGGTIDSRIFAGPPNSLAVMSWALNKVTDSSGNVMTVSYTSSMGEYVPSNVVYPGGSVDFGYEPRPDVLDSTLELSLIRQSKRLASMVVKTPDGAVRTYTLSYLSGDESKRSLLSKISLCSPSGECMPAALFEYSNALLGSGQNVTITGGYGVGADGWDVGDLFGDGADVYWTQHAGIHHATRMALDGTFTNWIWSNVRGVGNGGWRLVNAFGGGRKVYWTRHDSTHYVSQLNKDGTVLNLTYPNVRGAGDGGWEFVDLFGDGRDVYWTRHGTTHHAVRFNPDGTYQSWAWEGYGTGETGHRFVNLFGDGRKVYWTRHGATHHISRFNEDGTVDNWSVQARGEGNGGFEFADLFGEGRDLYWTRHDATHYASRFNPDGSVTNWEWANGRGLGNGGYRLVNLFGDGRKVYWTRHDTTHHVTRLNADGTLENFSYAGYGAGTAAWDFANLFGDGREVYWTFSDNGQHFASRFYPDGSVKNDAWTGHSKGADGWRMVDFVGDGKRRYWTHSGPSHHMTSSVDGEMDLLKAAKTEVSPGVSVSYLRLPQLEKAGRFVRDAVVTHPQLNMGYALSVVESASTSNGIGGTASTQHAYGNLISEIGSKGRGSLGFQWAQTKDVATGLVNRTYYRQDFPYIGMVDKSGKGTSDTNWSNLSLSTNEYKFMSFAANDANYSSPATCADDATGKTPAACASTAIQPGRRYVPYAWKSLNKAWDWNDQTGVFLALPQTRTTITQDNWANATEVFLETLDAAGATTGYTKKTNSVYAPANTVNWKFGRLLKSSVTTTAP